MATYTLTSGQVTYYSNLVPGPGETGNAIYGNNLSNNIYGNGYNDTIIGGAGNDYIEGAGGNDTLVGQTGNDTLLGGTGDDSLLAGDGNDTLYGASGYDTMYGGEGDDDYFHFMSDGSMDTINDDKSEAGVSGYGGGDDTLYLTDVALADLRMYHIGDNLYITDVYDISDGYINEGVNIEDFFLGGDNVIETLEIADATLDLTVLV